MKYQYPDIYRDGEFFEVTIAIIGDINGYDRWQLATMFRLENIFMDEMKRKLLAL